jgi:hypothetical protein
VVRVRSVLKIGLAIQGAQDSAKRGGDSNAVSKCRQRTSSFFTKTVQDSGVVVFDFNFSNAELDPWPAEGSEGFEFGNPR